MLAYKECADSFSFFFFWDFDKMSYFRRINFEPFVRLIFY